MSMKRPRVAGSMVTSPKAKTMISMLGPGLRAGPIVLTRDETEALNRLYGYRPEPPTARPPKPVFSPDPDAKPWERLEAEKAHKRAVDAWESWKDSQPLMQAGADRNMVRHAEADGLRLVAWLAKYVPAGTDPLKTLVQMAALAGWDVGPDDTEWADQEEEVDLLGHHLA